MAGVHPYEINKRWLPKHLSIQIYRCLREIYPYIRVSGLAKRKEYAPVRKLAWIMATDIKGLEK